MSAQHKLATPLPHGPTELGSAPREHPQARQKGNGSVHSHTPHHGWLGPQDVAHTWGKGSQFLMERPQSVCWEEGARPSGYSSSDPQLQRSCEERTCHEGIRTGLSSQKDGNQGASFSWRLCSPFPAYPRAQDSLLPEEENER